MLRTAGERDRSVERVLTARSWQTDRRKPPRRLLNPGTLTDDALAILFNYFN